MPARWPQSRLYGLFSTARWFASGSTAKQPQCRCWSLWECAKTARKCCWRSRAWAEKAARPGALFSTISSSVACGGLSVFSSMAHLDSHKAIAAMWEGVPVQRCTVHKHRNLLAHAPERLHEEITNDYNDMIYAATPEEIATRRKAFVRKWRLKHSAVADSLEEAGDRLFTFARLPPSQWKSARTTNAIERLHEEFKRRIKTQTVLPSADTAAMLFWALLASGQITMRKVDGWPTLAEKPTLSPLTSRPEPIPSPRRRTRAPNQFQHRSRRHQQALGGPLIATPLDQDVEHDPILIDGPPEPVLRSPDHQAHCVEMPFIARTGQPAADLVSKVLAELARPLAHGSMAHVDAAGRQQPP